MRVNRNEVKTRSPVHKKSNKNSDSGMETLESIFKLQNEQLRLITDALPVLISYIDKTGRYRFNNKTHEEWFGFKHEDIFGKTVKEVLGNDYPSLTPYIEEALKGHETSFETELTHQTQGRRRVNVLYRPHLEQGVVKGFFSLKRDVTERRKHEEEVQKSRDELDSFFENAPIAIHWVGPDGVVLRANRAELAMLGYTIEEYLGRHIGDFHHDQPKLSEILQSFSKGEAVSNHEAILRTKDGSLKHVLISSSVHMENGKYVHTRCFTRDITERKRAEAKLTHSRDQLESMLKGMTESVIVQNQNGHIIFANEKAAELLGVDTVEDLVNTTLEKIYSTIQVFDGAGKYIPLDQLPTTKAFGGKNVRGVVLRYRNLNTNKETWQLVNSSPILDSYGNIEYIISSASDLTEVKKKEEAIRKQSMFDNLTHLPNRTQLENELGRLVTAGHSPAVLTIDLDGFKNINDTLGYNFGDSLLVEAVSRIKRVLRSGDFLARLGGDKFVILKRGDTSTEEVSSYAQDIFDILEVPITILNYTVHISASIGITTQRASARNYQELIYQADLAMHRAKELGRRRFEIYRKDLGMVATSRLERENDIRTGIARDEFKVYYQPILDTLSGKIKGAEALVRWNHPKEGLLSPAEFIPIAEITGLILPLGESLIKKAFSHACGWKNTCREAPSVSINLSAVQFGHHELVNNVKTMIKETGMDPSCLEFEVTESVAMSNVERTTSILRNFVDLGIKINIDDFGTGYSSLAYLKHFPLSTLKIDRSFVQNCVNDTSDAAIINAIVTMAHKLGIRVTAEGVENNEQFKLLAFLGVDQIQGYLISRPISEERFAHWITKQNA